MNEITLNLAACRVNAGLTQVELGEKMGVTAATVIRWENGKTEPKLSQLRKIGEICNIPYDMIRLPAN